MLEQHVGKIRARLELLTARVENVEKLSTERMVRDLDALKRDMVRVAALAERGGAVKDHLNKLNRRLDELEGGAKAKNAAVTVDARVSRLARESEDARDKLTSRVEALETTLGQVLEQLAELTERVSSLAAAPTIAPVPDDEPTAERVAPPSEAPTAPIGAPDDLRKIKGIGPKYEKALHAAGVRTWAQIAAWSDADVDAIAERIGLKAARIRKAEWVKKAQALVAG